MDEIVYVSLRTFIVSEMCMSTTISFDIFKQEILKHYMTSQKRLLLKTYHNLL